MSPPAISLQNLQFAWPQDSHPLLYLPELNLAHGDHTFLFGPSGSGKTTLLSLLGGLLLPQSGHLQVLGVDLPTLSSPQRDAFRAQHIGFLFQQFNLLPYLSLVENVTLPCRVSKERAKRVGSTSQAWKTEAERLLSQLGLGELLAASRHTRELSVGQQQRVAAARALIGAPELVIADEPTSALDADARHLFVELLFEECERAGATLVFVSHDHSLASRFSRQLSLRDLNVAARERSGEGL
jgi:putative ABC transport system ATP-binding protein